MTVTVLICLSVILACVTACCNAKHQFQPIIRLHFDNVINNDNIFDAMTTLSNLLIFISSIRRNLSRSRVLDDTHYRGDSLHFVVYIFLFKLKLPIITVFVDWHCVKI